ncbi:hypothetical protein CALVIDRAFT_561433 [Calocera viscosa TUFC12733]|uniref:Uncharacterized protein n=1 Tax=Calocera viscosa (strain TUFC12733) TaxID=1330018 RepID=A0A167PPY2_CALVF|nr:hypothetical protein CALVIDRAFT_561433 [Calocera viscosa TUFC12733]
MFFTPDMIEAVGHDWYIVKCRNYVQKISIPSAEKDSRMVLMQEMHELGLCIDNHIDALPKDLSEPYEILYYRYKDEDPEIRNGGHIAYKNMFSDIGWQARKMRERLEEMKESIDEAKLVNVKKRAKEMVKLSEMAIMMTTLSAKRGKDEGMD